MRVWNRARVTDCGVPVGAEYPTLYYDTSYTLLRGLGAAILYGWLLLISYTISGVCYTIGYIYISGHERMSTRTLDRDTLPGKLPTVRLVTYLAYSLYEETPSPSCSLSPGGVAGGSILVGSCPLTPPGARLVIVTRHTLRVLLIPLSRAAGIPVDSPILL